MTFKNSPMYYMGNKGKLLPEIIPLFPKGINNFHDVFGGSGIVSINVDAKVTHYNELSKHTYNLFKFLMSKDKSELEEIYLQVVDEFRLIPGTGGKSNSKYSNLSLEQFEDLTSLSKDRYINCRNHLNALDPVVDYEDYYSLLWVLSFFSFSHNIRFNKTGGMNMPIGNDGGEKSMRQKILNHRKHLDIACYNLDYKDYLQNLKVGSDDFLYFDPPYTNSTAVYNESRENDGWSEQNDMVLFEYLETLDEAGINWGLSNVFKNKGFENTHLIKWCNDNGWNVHYINRTYSACGKGNSSNIEVYITNVNNEEEYEK